MLVKVFVPRARTASRPYQRNRCSRYNRSMADFGFVVVVISFFALGGAFVAGLDRVVGSGDDGPTSPKISLGRSPDRDPHAAESGSTTDLAS
jgi:hypothetical protein